MRHIPLKVEGMRGEKSLHKTNNKLSFVIKKLDTQCA